MRPRIGRAFAATLGLESDRFGVIRVRWVSRGGVQIEGAVDRPLAARVRACREQLEMERTASVADRPARPKLRPVTPARLQLPPARQREA